MLSLYEFINDSVVQIRTGIDKFNKENQNLQAFYPNEIGFEICVDHKGYIGGSNKINITVSLAHYPWNKKNENKL